MTVWWCALILLCCILNCVETSAPSPLIQRIKYSNSFRLTKSTRKNVQKLLTEYNKQQLDKARDRRLKDLPLLSTDFYSWLQLTDWERLHAAFWDMQAYWNMLDCKRKQLEREEKEQKAVKAIPTNLPQSIKHIQLDLRDLMSQVSSQMSDMRNSRMKPTFPTAQTPLNQETNSETHFDRQMEGYIILRDLDLYLTKLARDFLLLASKTHF